MGKGKSEQEDTGRRLGTYLIWVALRVAEKPVTVAEVACWAEAGAALAKRAARPARVVVNFIVMIGGFGVLILVVVLVSLLLLLDAVLDDEKVCFCGGVRRPATYTFFFSL